MREPALPASVEAGRSSLGGTVRGWRGCRDDIAKGREASSTLDRFEP
jgi:hypothetical protein